MDYNRLHQTLIALHRPAHWRWWQVAAIVIVLATTAGLPSLWAAGNAGVGLALAAGYLLFVALDGALLAALPRWHLSFGPVQPPLLALAVVRWLAGLAAALTGRWLPPAWPLAALGGGYLLLSGLAVYGCVVEPFRLTVTELELRSPKLAGLPRPLRLLHLSDLHMERPTPRDERVLALAAELTPDLILLTGDYLNLSYTEDDAAIAHARRWLSRLHAPLGVYAVLGTPEVDVRQRAHDVFADTGVRLLGNETVGVAVGGREIALIGVTCERDLDIDRAGLEAALRHVPQGAFTILLYHIPDLMPEAVVRGIDLYLAGHTHGGQWRLPGYGAVITSSAYGKRYEMGHYVEGQTHLYVSRGLGLEGLAAPRARFLCPPEVVWLTLRGGRSFEVEERR
ncbi:MAG: metallophosphoesterase [Anaerolineae bacterium]|nr:metallophosphoesterase [Anaerolineae bacterium]